MVGKMHSSTENKAHIHAILLLLLTGLLWSVGGVFIKISAANPFALSSIRGGVAALVFMIILKGRPRFTFNAPQIIGAVAYSVTLTCAVLAYTLTSAANAILIQYTCPIYAAILGYFILHERLHWYDFLSVAGVLFGMWLLVSNQFSGNSQLGNGLALLGGICFALLSVMLRLQKDQSPYETILLGNILTFLIGLPFLFMHPPVIASVPPIVFLGVFQIGIPYYLYTRASKHAKALDLTIIPVLEPLLNPVWVFLATGEFPGMRAVWGGLILLGVVTLKSLLSAQRKD